MNTMMPNTMSGMPNMNMMNMGMMNPMHQNDISMYITSQPNTTIIVCDIPMDCTERDLSSIMSKYGLVKDVQKTPDNKNALVEFQDVGVANHLVSMGRNNPFFVGANRTRLEFSSQKINRMNSGIPPMQSQTVSQMNMVAENGEPGVTNILHIEIGNAQYPITTEVLNTICSPNGKVARICIGKKSPENTIEALVEFESANDAKSAKENLNGADIYSGCCTLTITFSKLARVHVVKNDAESWDYTNPNPGKEGLLGSQPQSKTLLGDNSKLISNPSMNPNQLGCPPMSGGMGMMNPNMGNNMMNMNPGMNNMGMGGMQPPMGMGNNMMGMNNMGMGMNMNGPNPMGMGGPNPMAMGMNGPGPNGMGMNGPMGMGMNGPNQMGMGMNQMGGPMNMGNSSSDYFTMRPPPGTGMSPAMLAKGQYNKKPMIPNSKSKAMEMTATFDTGDGVVLMCYNLADNMTCDHLFNLFCVYGNVAKIKFLKSRQGCAMVQMGSKDAAELVLKHYDAVTIFGKQIQVCRSKQTEVQDLNSTATLDNGSPISKNFMNDPNNRFKNQAVASKSRILDPCRTLHFFNAPPSYTVDDLMALYKDSDLKVPVKACVFPTKGATPTKTSLGLVEWENLDDALEMMALTNHYQVNVANISHPFHLKLAFSPRNIQEEGNEEAEAETEPKPIAGQKRKLEQ